ncbi:uncharacterized protein [Pagrus major]|uniref:uncharacterized protein n=1 Tax=Pagrus major TaxID=143350 RepID=UPI003CC8CE9E
MVRERERERESRDNVVLSYSEELQEALCRYTTDTLTYINTVREFCEGISSWMDAREKELTQLWGIKGRADKVDLSFSHVTEPMRNCKTEWEYIQALPKCMNALWEYLKNKLTQEITKRRRAKLKKELADVLEVTLGGLKKLDNFREAVEKLAVTSFHVFVEENQVLHLPRGISLEHVQVVIIAAQRICPLLLEVKRDASVFTLSKLQNVEVLSDQLYKYIKTTRKICEELKESDSSFYSLHVQSLTTEIVVELTVSEEGVQERLCDINLLNEIRMGEHFRTVFLFKDKSCSDFINQFSDWEPRMLEFERAADYLTYPNSVAKVFSVLSSFVGVCGGLLSITGLALITTTKGVPLIQLGAYLGIFSTAIIVIAFIIEFFCNQKKNINKHFQSLQRLHGCLEKVTSHPPTQIQESEKDVVVGVDEVVVGEGEVVVGEDEEFVGEDEEFVGEDEVVVGEDEVYVGKEEVVVGKDKVVQKVPAVFKFIDLLADIVGASDIPEICQTAVKGPLANLMLFVPNVISCVMDLHFFRKHGCSLAKCNETKVSQFIRARAALWSSEMNSWKKIHDSLCKGQKTSEEHRAVLDKLFIQGGQ